MSRGLGDVYKRQSVEQIAARGGRERARIGERAEHVIHLIMGCMELSQRLNLGDFSKLLDADEPENNTPADTFSRLAALIERVTGEEDSVSPSTALTDTVISSLDRIELAIRIEDEFGARITERIYDECETVGELADYLEDEQ